MQTFAGGLDKMEEKQGLLKRMSLWLFGTFLIVFVAITLTGGLVYRIGGMSGTAIFTQLFY